MSSVHFCPHGSGYGLRSGSTTLFRTRFNQQFFSSPQHWLQLTYEMESRVYNEKRRCAEAQMEAAKDACEKIKRKRSSLVGAFVSTHGRSIDDVDKSILGAKTALLELTQDLTERSRRWRQIEMLTGVNIVTNPGLPTLQKIGKWDRISCLLVLQAPMAQVGPLRERPVRDGLVLISPFSSVHSHSCGLHRYYSC
jgi:hypothetical protein